jgi:hypothetical protein
MINEATEEENMNDPRNKGSGAGGRGGGGHIGGDGTGSRGNIERKSDVAKIERKGPGAGTFVSFDRPIPPEKDKGKG